MAITTSLSLDEDVREILQKSNVKYQDVFNYGLIYMGLNGSGKDRTFLIKLKSIIADRVDENKRLIKDLNRIIARLENPNNGSGDEIKKVEPKDKEESETRTNKAIEWIRDPENKAYSVLALRGLICQICHFNPETIDSIPKDPEDVILYIDGTEKATYFKTIWETLKEREDLPSLIPDGIEKAKQWLRDADEP